MLLLERRVAGRTRRTAPLPLLVPGLTLLRTGREFDPLLHPRLPLQRLQQLAASARRG